MPTVAADVGNEITGLFGFHPFGHAKKKTTVEAPKASTVSFLPVVIILVVIWLVVSLLKRIF